MSYRRRKKLTAYSRGTVVKFFIKPDKNLVLTTNLMIIWVKKSE